MRATIEYSVLEWGRCAAPSEECNIKSGSLGMAFPDPVPSPPNRRDHNMGWGRDKLWVMSYGLGYSVQPTKGVTPVHAPSNDSELTRPA